MDINYSALPEHCQGAVKRYVEKGIEPGGFLTSVIINNLRGAVGCADAINSLHLRDYVEFFYNEAPSECWGSMDKFNAWIKAGGIEGLSKERNHG